MCNVFMVNKSITDVLYCCWNFLQVFVDFFSRSINGEYSSKGITVEVQ